MVLIRLSQTFQKMEGKLIVGWKQKKWQWTTSFIMISYNNIEKTLLGLLKFFQKFIIFTTESANDITENFIQPNKEEQIWSSTINETLCPHCKTWY